MNNYYGHRLVKFVSPQFNVVFSLELGGNELELKDLIATILNVSIGDLKGIRDLHNNYYTFSSAIKNQNLTNTHSQYYTIVLSSSFNNDGQRKPSTAWNMNTFANTPKSISHFKTHQGAVVINSTRKQADIIKELLKEKLIEEKHVEKIQRMLNEENNEEMITLFSAYNGYDLKIFAEKIMSLISSESDQSSNKSQLISYNDILDSIEDHFEDKKDLMILKQLISFDNEQIFKAFQLYEDDCDVIKLVDNLNQLVIKYRGKLGDMTNSSEKKIIQKDVKSSNETVNTSTIISSNIKRLLKKISFELRASLSYAKKYDNFAQLFNLEQNLDNSNNENNSICLLRKYYTNFMENEVFKYMTKEEIEKYNQMIIDPILNQDLRNSFMDFEEHNDPTILRKDIEKVLKASLPNKEISKKEVNTKQYNEEFDKKNSSSICSSGKEEEQKNNESNKILHEKKNEEGHIMKNKQTVTLKYQNSNNSINKQRNSSDTSISKQTTNNTPLQTKLSESLVNKQNSIRESNEKESKLGTNVNSIPEDSSNRKVNDFMKVVNTMQLIEENKVQIKQLVNDNEPKIMKVVDNFQRNKMSLSKVVLLNVLNEISFTKGKADSKTNNVQIIKEDKPANPVSNPKLTFATVIDNLEKNQMISSGEGAFIKMRFQNNDEMLFSIWEAYERDNDEGDFLESLKTYIDKHQSNKVPQFDSIGTKTPISIKNTKKDFISLIRANEKNERTEKEEQQTKKKTFISLLVKEKLIEPDTQMFFNMKIDSEDPKLASFFQVLSITKDHRDFVESLNGFRSIMYNKNSHNNNDPLVSHTNNLNELLKKSRFNDMEKDTFRSAIKQSDQNLLSIIEAYEKDKNADKAIENLEISLKKLMKKKN